MSDSNREAIERHQDLEKVFELKKKADKFPIPTNDETVKSMLRQLGKPVCLFGEDNSFRRERLKVEISNYFTNQKEAPEFEKDNISDDSDAGQ